jgi:tRNA dimethylallyltransferase
MPSVADAQSNPPLVVIVGPTAVGKTALAVRLAAAVGGEIISADSRQIYRGMDIGTAKATAEEQAQAPHHLVDILDPSESMGLASFLERVTEAIADIVQRGLIPFLVGGTGQYIRAVIEGWQVPRVRADETLRRELYQRAESDGPTALHTWLQELDPTAASRIDARNVRRTVRALEVCLLTGRRFSEQQHKSPPPYSILILGLTLPRAQLYERIDRRVDWMIENGLEEEVRALIDEGYGFDLPAMSGVGYGQFEAYLDGQAELSDVVREIKRATRRFVRQQGNWFRHDDDRIAWLDADQDPFDAALSLVQAFLKSLADRGTVVE